MTGRRGPPGTLRPVAWPGRRAAVALCAAGVAIVSGCGEPASLPDPSSEAYRRAVTTFHVGLAAAQVGLEREAEERWLETVSAAPGEPAAWADLAVLALRRNEPDLAIERMERAVRLAPESPAVRYAAGVAAVAIGRWDAAREHLAAAVEADPDRLPALFALAELAERGGREEGVAEAGRWLDRILEVEPASLAARLERARVAAKQGDEAALRAHLERLGDGTASWPTEARERLAALEAATDGPPERIAPEVAMLANVLKRAPEYRESLRALEPEGSAAGVLLERFVRLPAPGATPAAPDTALAFEARPIEFDRPAATEPVVARAFAFDGEAPPTPVAATADRVRLPGGRVVPFPGGGEPAAPSPHALLAADLDNDYRMELVLAGAGGTRILAGSSGAGFEDVTRERGVPPAAASGRYSGVWAVDLDLEGDLDLVLGSVDGPPVVLINGAEGALRAAEYPFEAVGLRDLAWADLDGDGDPDLALLDGEGRTRIWINRGAGRYDAWSPPAPLRPALALEVVELDGDGALDLVALGDGFRIARLPTPADPRGSALVEPKGPPPPSETRPPTSSARLVAADLDNNGCVDLVASIDDESAAYLCDREGWGADRRPGAVPALDVDGFVTDVADLDGDGRIDLVGTVAGRPTAFQNRGRAEHGWLRLRPRAAERAGDQRVNAFGLAGEVEVRAGLHYQKLPVDAPVVHVGLGERDAADLARIAWPNGLVQVEFGVGASESVAIEQRLMGSCPWLFAFDGEGMAFVTDVLWRSPLGMRSGAGGTLPVPATEDRVLLAGERLAARDGVYELRITSELWETFYFDHVALIAVDHPAGTSVHVDERFAFPPPDLEVRASEPPRPVARAVDDRGREVTDRVRAVDGRHVGVAEPGAWQGVTRDHFVEIDLGPDAIGRKHLRLVATGWVRPMDSAARIAVAQGAGPEPRSLALEIPDGRGGWRVARADLGFPAGKSKTIVLDLEDLWGPEERPRLRLRTNLEIYWDALAWTVARPEDEIRRSPVPLAGSELVHRGFSRTATASPTSPEEPVYAPIAGTAPRWRDLEGYYTRFGEVTELLAGVDDRYVIMNAGDEIRLRFRVPPPPPDGWTRDYVVVTDGWGKNGDYGTALREGVLPLPSHARPAYDGPAVPLEEDPVYRRHAGDWSRYHTRYVTAAPFGRALVPE